MPPRRLKPLCGPISHPQKVPSKSRSIRTLTQVWLKSKSYNSDKHTRTHSFIFQSAKTIPFIKYGDDKLHHFYFHLAVFLNSNSISILILVQEKTIIFLHIHENNSATYNQTTTTALSFYLTTDQLTLRVTSCWPVTKTNLCKIAAVCICNKDVEVKA